MEIKRKREQGFEVLILDGRLDAYWSDHLESELTKCIRDGIYKLRIDMSAVSYLNSAATNTNSFLKVPRSFGSSVFKYALASVQAIS